MRTEHGHAAGGDIIEFEEPGRDLMGPVWSRAKRNRRQRGKLPGSRRWSLPHRQNEKLRRSSRPSARRLNKQNASPTKIREVGEPAKSEVATKPESSISDGPSFTDGIR